MTHGVRTVQTSIYDCFQENLKGCYRKEKAVSLDAFQSVVPHVIIYRCLHAKSTPNCYLEIMLWMQYLEVSSGIGVFLQLSVGV